MKKKLQILFSTVVLWCLALGASAEITDGGKYYLKNVEAGLYLGASNGWGTQASLVPFAETVTLAKVSDGVYQITDYFLSTGKYYLASNGYLDSDTPVDLTFTVVDEKKNQYTIANGAAYYGYDTATKSTVLALNLAKGAKGTVWELIPVADLNEARYKKPVDATFLLKNANFDIWRIPAWNSIGSSNLYCGICSPVNWTANPTTMPDNSNPVAEKFKGSFVVSQSLTVPNGIYRVKAQCYYRIEEGNEENVPVVYAGDKEVKFPHIIRDADKITNKPTGTGYKTYKDVEVPNNTNAASAAFTEGLYWSDEIEYIVSDNNLEVGFKCSASNFWSVFDNMQITYCGNDKPDYDATVAAHKLIADRWAEIQSEVNTWDAQAKDEVWKSTVKGDALDLMNQANDILVAALKEADAAFADGTISAKKSEIEAKIAAAKSLIDQAYAKAKANYVVAKAAIAVNKAIPAGKYYIYNKTVDGYLAPANDWQTQASIVGYSVEWTLATSKNGVYTFESVVDNGGKHFLSADKDNNMWCDGESTKLYISAFDNDDNPTTFYIRTSEDDSKAEYIAASGSVIKNASVKASGDEWVIISTTDAKKRTKYENVTFFIKDAALSRNNRYYSSWSVAGATEPKTSEDGQKDKKDTKDTRYAQEAYKKAFNVNQTLTVPEGYYTLNVQAFSREDGDKKVKPVIFANGDEKTVNQTPGSENSIHTAAVSFENGSYLNIVEVHVGKDGKLNIGIKSEDNSAWNIWKNFSLTFNEKDNSKYEAQVYGKIKSAYNEYVNDSEDAGKYYDAKKAIEATGACFDTDGKIFAAIKKVWTNTESVDVKNDKGAVVGTKKSGFGINEAYYGTTFNGKTYNPTIEAKVDSLYGALAQATAIVDSYLENIEIAAAAKKYSDDIKPLWQATYDIINTKYNAEKVLSGTDAPSFKKEMEALRAEFVKELSNLNDIDAKNTSIKNDTVQKYLIARQLTAKMDDIKAEVDALKDKIIATLNDAQDKSLKALTDAVKAKDDIYVAAINTIEEHYAKHHKGIADDVHVKLFKIHEELQQIAADATADYNKVVAANAASIKANELPTEGFEYAVYVKKLEDVNADGIATDLANANAEAIKANNTLIDYTYINETKVIDKKTVLVGGTDKIKADFNEAVKGTAYVTKTMAELAENKDKKFDANVVAIAKAYNELVDTLKYYKDVHNVMYLDLADASDKAKAKDIRDRGVLIYTLDKDGKETTTLKDTLICVYDAEAYITKALADQAAAVAELAEAIKASDADKVDLAKDNTALKTLWNQSYAGLNKNLDPEADLDEIHDGIENIRLNKLENDYFIYDETSYNKDKADMAEWTMALSDYDKWVETYCVPGDANLDREVTIADVILQLSYVLEEQARPETKRGKFVTDADGDGAFDINDVQATINAALGIVEEAEEEEAAEARARELGSDYLVIAGNEISLVNTRAYSSFQMDVTVANGAIFNGAALTSRASELTVAFNKISDNTYRVIGYALKKVLIADSEGALVELNVVGDDNVSISNAIFSDSKANKYTLSVFTEAETAIAGINASVAEGAEIYTVNGARVNTLQKGINLVKNVDGTVRKVLVK